MYERVDTYETAAAKKGSTLDSLAGFTNCTEIQIWHSEGQKVNQGAVYSSHSGSITLFI